MSDSGSTMATHRRFRYRLRTLVAVWILLAIGVGWVSIKMRQAQERERAVAEVQGVRGWVVIERLYVCGLLVSVDVPRVEMGGQQVDDETVRCLAHLPCLRKLGLARTQLSDSGLTHLTGLAELRELDLSGSLVTEEGVKKLQRELPKCKILFQRQKDGAE